MPPSAAPKLAPMRRFLLLIDYELSASGTKFRESSRLAHGGLRPY